MSYDIGIGKCAAIDATSVGVHLDSVMVSRLLPDQPWRKSGTSMLQISLKVCSSKRPPEVGAEVYLDRAALAKDSKASLDLAGDGVMIPVNLQRLLKDLDPNPAPAPATKGRGSHSKAKPKPDSKMVPKPAVTPAPVTTAPVVQAAPKAVPKAAPKAAPEAAPKAAPKTAAKAAAKAAPKAAPKAASKTAAKPSPKAVAKPAKKSASAKR
ncbi:MAG: hypothetical protein ABIP56_04900 [Dokdonella sp.]